MPKKGQRLYKCNMCGGQSMYHWVELNRANGMKCHNCGSRSLEICSEEGKVEIEFRNDILRGGGTRSTEHVVKPRDI